MTIRFVCFALVAVVAWGQEPVVLELGKPVTAELAGGQRHVYVVRAAPGEFVRVNVRRPALSTTIQVVDPRDSSTVAKMNWGASGLNTICWIAASNPISTIPVCSDCITSAPRIAP